MTEAQGRVGRWLRNKWHLDSLIAIGGMAAVYSSTHRNGARAAIKMLHSQYTRNEQARRRFLAEGYAANKVGHRNAVLVLDDDATEDGEVYLVMELLDGESLEGRLERVGVMGPMEVLALTDQLLEVLACAHPKGILHRDIKPANIYLTRDGAVKLLDFGLARVRELSAEAMDQSDGIVFGTVSYIAPEQARADNQNLDARSDMWSIAATMFRALSGETVHPSTGPVIDRLMAVARKPPRSIASVVPHLPRQVIELVDRALAFDPENRWPSANVMRVVVQDVMAQLREEAEARGGDDEMTGMFARPPLGSGIANRHRGGAELPSVRSGTAPQAGEELPPRPKTDPVALSMRPRSLPGRQPEEVDLEVDLETAARPEQKGRRSRTLLTKEGRAELRRILDARKAGAEARPDDPTPRPVRGEPPAEESGSGDIDVDVDDSIIEVTIDHTHRGRPGPIAEALADNTTPAPARADPSTGSFAAVPEDRKPTAPTAAPPRSGLDDSRSRREPRPAAASEMDDSRSRRTARAASTPAVPEDRRTASTASYPTLGGATSKPIQPRAPEPARGAPATPRNEEITRVAPAPSPPSPESATGPAPISGEIGSRGPADITRVGPPPAPAKAAQARPAEPTRPANLHETLRPKTIPPVSGRPASAGRPIEAPRSPAPQRPEVKPQAAPAKPAEAAKPDVKPTSATVDAKPRAEVTPVPVKAEVKPRVEAAPVPVKVEAKPAARVEVAPVKVEARPAAPVEATPAPVKVEAKPAVPVEVTPAPVKVEAKPVVRGEATPAKAESGEPEAPKSAPARAGVFAAPPSRGGAPVTRVPVVGPNEPLPQRGATSPAEPARVATPAPGFAGLPSRGTTRPGSSEPMRAASPVIPSRSTPPTSPVSAPAAPAAAPPPAAAPAAAPTAPAAAVPSARPAATPVVRTPAPAAAAPAAVRAPAATPGNTGAPRPTPSPAAARPTETPAAPAAPRTAPQPIVPAEPTPEPVSKDSEAEAAARAAAPTAAHPVVPAEEPPGPQKLRAGAPVLPFSFLRSGPAARPAEPTTSEPPPGDGTPPRKKP